MRRSCNGELRRTKQQSASGSRPLHPTLLLEDAQALRHLISEGRPVHSVDDGVGRVALSTGREREGSRVCKGNGNEEVKTTVIVPGEMLRDLSSPSLPPCRRMADRFIALDDGEDDRRDAAQQRRVLHLLGTRRR